MDFDDDRYEKGYMPFNFSAYNFKANIGKKICYVATRDVDKYRGHYFVRYGTIHSVRYKQLFLGEDGDTQIDINNILECGIQI